MATTLHYFPSPARDELARALRAARIRWRVRVALHGAAIAAGLGLLAVGLAAAGMERLAWTPEHVRTLRYAAYAMIALLLAWFVVRPLLRRIPDERLALYLEEHAPSLDAALVSAVEERGGRATSLHALLERDALARLRTADLPRIERRGLARGAAMLALAAAAWVALITLGPEWMRRGASALFLPARAAAAVTPYSIAVQPGNTTVARGGDQRIAARLVGFGSDEVVLAMRPGDGEWERIPMGAGADSTTFAARLFDIDARTRYYVEAAGVRSPEFTLDVADLPAVKRIDLDYRYPAYTGLAPRTVEDGGDIAAVRGTVVRVRIVPTMPVRAGRIVVEGRDTILLAADSAGALAGELTVRKPGFYEVALQGATGAMAGASLDYAIDVLDDEAPTVRFRKPGRDLKVTALEEVFAEAVAEDDYGVRRLELVYTVNGGAPKTLVLHDAGAPRREVSGTHTFYLEEMSLRPGDLVSYFARASDGDRVSGAKSASTDIYFMEVRPFGQEYRQAEQSGGMPGQGQPDAAWSQRQREIVAGTFNARRDRAASGEPGFRENVATLALAQGRLREQVEGVVQRLGARGLVSEDSTLADVAEELPKAIAEMRAAEQALGRRDADAALPAEQRALAHLLRAESAFRERQVATGQEGGGGGGGGSAEAEELADLFELETDKLRNQYETVQRGQTEQADREVDETLERLRRLAARQQQENERMREMASRMQARAGSSGGGSGGESQRQLAREAEEMARQLERLARERGSDELRDAAQRLRESAATMRRQAAAGEQGSAEGSRAASELENARRALERSRGDRLERDARDAARRAEALAGRQREVAEEVARTMTGEGDRAERERRVFERKDEMTGEVEALERDLERMSREARRGQPEASRRLQQAADAIREGRVADKLRFSKEVMRGGSPEYARNFEEQLGANLEEVRRRTAAAADAVREPEGRVASRALDRARDLVRGLESMRERAEARAEGRTGQERGREGQSSRAGQQGQHGQRGQGQGEGQQGDGEGQAQRGEGRGGAAEGAPSGQPGQLPRGEYGRASGDARPGTARGSAQALSPDEIRQLARELGERRAEAEALRRDLRREGMDASDIEALVGRLRELEQGAAAMSPEELSRLQGAVVDGFKAFEFALRRMVEGDARQPLLGASDEVPPEYRRLVEEYYKSLARRGPR